MKMSRCIAQSALGLGVLVSLWGCGTQQELSEIKVTNGRVLQDADFPSVVLLYDAKKGSICTGTFITHNTVLTAAHCTEGGAVTEAGQVDVTLSLISVKDAQNKTAEFVAESRAVYRNPLWDTSGKNVNRFDLGLVVFPDRTARAVSEFASSEPKVGDVFEIVGYGVNQNTNQNDPASAGVKRYGTNKITGLEDGFIQFTGANKTSDATGTNSSAGSGDSGGPLFIEGKLAGVTSGGGWGGFGKTRSLYVNLATADSQAFLDRFLP